MSYGEKIGTYKRDGFERRDSRTDHERFQTRKLLTDLAVKGVLAGAGRTRVDVAEDGVNYSIYAEPPIRDPEEAHRLGQEINNLLQEAHTGYPYGALVPTEMDTFEPTPTK